MRAGNRHSAKSLSVPFCSNVYSINVHLLAFIVLCYPHAFASDPEFHAQYTFEDIKKNKLIFYGFTKLVEVIGYTLTLERGDGEVYTCYIAGTTFHISQELSGIYKITISDKDCNYQGILEIF